MTNHCVDLLSSLSECILHVRCYTKIPHVILALTLVHSKDVWFRVDKLVPPVPITNGW